HRPLYYFVFFSLQPTANTDLYSLSLHDALPIYGQYALKRPERQTIYAGAAGGVDDELFRDPHPPGIDNSDISRRPRNGEQKSMQDRKSTRLNSSHQIISYAVFCLKKKKKNKKIK